MSIAIEIRENRSDLHKVTLFGAETKEPIFVHNRVTGRRICICHFTALADALAQGLIQSTDLLVTCYPLQARHLYNLETAGDWNRITYIRFRWEPGGYVLYVWAAYEPAPF